MKNRKLRALVASLISAVIVGNVAYADSTINELQEVTDDSECEVYADIESDFKVIIPKIITLDGATKTGTYTVSVIGDIAGNEYVKVVPDESFILSSINLNDVTATITQDKTEWSCDEITDASIIGNGAINASGITAGIWSGHFYFNVSLEKNEVSVLHEHIYDEGVVTVEATCSEVGTKLFSCNCGSIYTESIPALEHNYEDGICTNCNEIEIHEHIYDEGVITTTATCTALGIRTYTCECSNSYTEEIPATGHSYENGICINCGEAEPIHEHIFEEGVCTECGEVEEVHEHNYTSEITKEATCTEAGETTYTCECGDFYTEEISILEHEYTEESIDATCTTGAYIDYKCNNCDDSYSETTSDPTGHSFENGTCISCGDVEVTEDTEGIEESVVEDESVEEV